MNFNRSMASCRGKRVYPLPLLAMVVLCLACSPAYGCLVYFYNGTNYTVIAQYAYSSDQGVTWSSYSSLAVGAGQTNGVNMSTGVQRKLRWYDSTGSGIYVDIGTFADAPCNQTFNYPVAPVVQYTNSTASICLTNTSTATDMPIRIFYCLDGGSPVQDMSAKPALAPGEKWCFSKTTASGHRLTCFYAEYFSDGWHTQNGGISDNVSGSDQGPGGSTGNELDDGWFGNGDNPADEYPGGTNSIVNDDLLARTLREILQELQRQGGLGNIGGGYLGGIYTNTLGGLGGANTNLNIPGLTNVAQEGTLKGLTNLVGNGMSTLQSTMNSNAAQAHGDFMNLTNMLGGTNIHDSAGMMVSGRSAGAGGSNTLVSLASSLTGKGTVAAGSSSGMTSSVTAQMFGGQVATINFDLFALDWVQDLANIVRNIIGWGCYFVLIWGCAKTMREGITAGALFRQATASGQAILGNNANFVTATAMAVAITLILGVMPTTAYMYFATDGAFSLSNLTTAVPEAGTNAMAWSVWAVQQFIPIGLIVVCNVNYLIFLFTWTAIEWGVSTVVRFLVG